MGLIIIIMKYLVLMVALIESATAATTHEVGGSDGWKVPTSNSFYTTWAGQQTFSVGDTLEFKWTLTHDVQEVTKSEYENCTTTNGLHLWGSTSPVSVTLENTTARYFICTIPTHCSGGQKLAIVSVSETNSTTTPSGSSPSGSSASTPTTAALLSSLLISSTAIVSFFNI